MGASSEEIKPKFKWHSFIYTIVQMTNRTDKDVYQMEYMEALSWLAFEQDRVRVQNLINKKQNKR